MTAHIAQIVVLDVHYLKDSMENEPEWTWNRKNACPDIGNDTLPEPTEGRDGM